MGQSTTEEIKALEQLGCKKLLPKRRSRKTREALDPKAKFDKRNQKPLLEDQCKKALLNPSTPAVYVSTTKGSMKLNYEGHHFYFKFKKGQYTLFNCCFKENGEECKVRVVVFNQRVYHMDGEHVHYRQAVDKSATTVAYEAEGTPQEQVEQQFFDIINEDEQGPIYSLTENSDRYSAADSMPVYSVTELKPAYTATENISVYSTSDNVYSSGENITGYTIAKSESNYSPPRIKLLNKSPVSNPLVSFPPGGGGVVIKEDPEDFKEKIKKRLQNALLKKL